MEVVEKMKKHLLEAALHGVSQIHVALGNFAMGFGRFAEDFRHAVGEMPGEADRAVVQDLHSLVTAESHEVIQVELKTAAFQSYDFTDLLAVGVLPVGRKAHDLSFVAVFLVADKLADHGVEAA